MWKAKKETHFHSERVFCVKKNILRKYNMFLQSGGGKSTGSYYYRVCNAKGKLNETATMVAHASNVYDGARRLAVDRVRNGSNSKTIYVRRVLSNGSAPKTNEVRSYAVKTEKVKVSPSFIKVANERAEKKAVEAGAKAVLKGGTKEDGHAAAAAARASAKTYSKDDTTTQVTIASNGVTNAKADRVV